MFMSNVKCSIQEHRAKQAHSTEALYPPDNCTGPCWVNEGTSHLAGYGTRGLLSFDWKHFPFEDYGEFLWGQQGPWQ